MPTAANLNLYKVEGIRVFAGIAMMSRCFGWVGTSKLIVSVSFGSQAFFKWKGKSFF